jgi:hypothetical protein
LHSWGKPKVTLKGNRREKTNAKKRHIEEDNNNKKVNANSNQINVL